MTDDDVALEQLAFGAMNDNAVAISGNHPEPVGMMQTAIEGANGNVNRRRLVVPTSTDEVHGVVLEPNSLDARHHDIYGDEHPVIPEAKPTRMRRIFRHNDSELEMCPVL